MSGEHGERTEDILEIICSRMFGPDLVLRSPVVAELSGKKEVADIIVLIDETIVVIQSKSLDIDLSELTETNFGRVRKRHEAAKRQLNTLLNSANRQAEVRGITCLGVEVIIDWSLIKRTIGIVTLNLPDEAYKDPEFRFQYPEPCTEQRGIEVHSFVLRDLWEASVEISTPGDALLYLKARQQCLATEKFVVGNELDFLALYKTDYPKIQRALLDPEFHVFVTPGLWEAFRSGKTSEIADRQNRQKFSYIIDFFVGQLRAGVEYSIEAHKLTAQESAIGYLRVIGKLGKLTRTERARIGCKLIEKAKKTISQKFGYFIYVSMEFRIAYLFLVLNEEDRRKRSQFLHFLVENACHQVDATHVVAIGTNGPESPDSSIDAMIADVEEMKSHTEPDSAMPFFGEMQMDRFDEWS